ncbi:hypothetical protein Tco_0275924 [Tanacetum coccineum]
MPKDLSVPIKGGTIAGDGGLNSDVGVRPLDQNWFIRGRIDEWVRYNSILMLESSKKFNNPDDNRTPFEVLQKSNPVVIIMITV